jgi:hypothetical protein
MILFWFHPQMEVMETRTRASMRLAAAWQSSASLRRWHLHNAYCGSAKHRAISVHRRIISAPPVRESQPLRHGSRRWLTELNMLFQAESTDNLVHQVQVNALRVPICQLGKRMRTRSDFP